MKLSRPKDLTFWIALIMGGLGLLGHFVSIPFASAYSFWLVAVGFVLLVLGVLVKGL
ncbi:MAG TPA: hypothetical protein VMC62_12175 [Longilinea sp.]|nr:hypothetical protein [Longilinea sp.]